MSLGNQIRDFLLNKQRYVKQALTVNTSDTLQQVENNNLLNHDIL